MACLLAAVLVIGGVCPAQAKQVSIHDPVMAKEGDTFTLFSTGPGITFYRSKDLKTWTLGGRVFADEPTWAKSVAPKFNGHIWAPDIHQRDGTFYLYYSVSSFGKNTSAIGLTINRTLDPKSPDFRWEDQGIVVRSVPNRDLWNAIDPNLVVDETGTAWLAFGSFWGGLKMVKLAPDWKSLAQPEEWHSIAKRERSVLISDTDAGPAEIEAPFIFRKNGWYYLFISWDRCCAGKDSTYKMVFGRSRSVTGPYLDKTGKDLAAGGGSLLLAGDSHFAGVGHNSAYTFDGKDYLIFHAYENADGGLQKLKIAELQWDDQQWPKVDPAVLESFVSVLEK